MVFAPELGRFSQDSAGPIAATVAALKATSGSSGDYGSTLRWQSQLDSVLREVRNQIGTAFAQASVLLTALLTGAILVLLLVADLLVRRRGPTLVATRHRGASLLDLGAELVVESATVSLLAAAAGLAVARAIAPGVEWSWVLPVVLAGAAAGPAFGVVAAARATNDRRAPANRSARRWARNTARLRRAAVVGAVLAAAAIATLTLYQRGIRPALSGEVTGSSAALAGGAALPISAPALGALAAALLLLPILPAGTGLILRRALRSRRPLAVFGAARAVATAHRVLPLVTLLTAAALASFALTLDATARQGLVAGAWDTVGADARLDIEPGAAASQADLSARLATAPGVRQALAAQVIEPASVAVDGRIVTLRLVVVDAAAFHRLLAATPLPDGPGLDRLVAPGRGAVPALVRSRAGPAIPDGPMELLRDRAPALPLTAIGTAPAIGAGTDVVIVDAATLEAAGQPVVPNTVWLYGPGAAAAANAAAASTVGVTAVLRLDVEREHRVAPLTAGLLRLAWGVAAALLVLALLAVALGAAAGAPDRWQTLTRLRTLGLRPRDARWVAAGELLPPVVLAAVGGPLLGVLLARLTLGPLALVVLTGQSADPAIVAPWWWLGLIAAAYVATIAAVVPIESIGRRRRRLGEVLRAGDE
jgi:putative ABC transport system permease protein